VRIGDVGRVVTGKTPPTARAGLFGSEYPFITPSDMGSDTRRVSVERGVSELGRAFQPQYLLPRKAVAVVCIGATIGKICMVDRPSFTNQQINAVIANESRFDADFIFYALRLAAPTLLGLAGGAATPILNKSAFSDVTIEVPDLGEQCSIASILSAYDDLIENNTRRIAVLEEMARRLYEEWFVHFRFPGHEQMQMVESELGLIPEGWALGKLADFLQLSYGKALKAETRLPGPFPVYGSSGVVGFHSTYLVRGPGIILGRKGNVGSVHWCDTDFYPIDTVYFVGTNLPLPYVYFNLQTQNFLNNDAAVPGLNRNQAYSLPFIRPSDEVLNAFEKIALPIFQSVRNTKARNNNLRAQRDLLLPKLISGEIDVSAFSTETALEN